jgi:hypothetical protein
MFAVSSLAAPKHPTLDNGCLPPNHDDPHARQDQAARRVRRCVAAAEWAAGSGGRGNGPKPRGPEAEDVPVARYRCGRGAAVSVPCTHRQRRGL